MAPRTGRRRSGQNDDTGSDSGSGTRGDGNRDDGDGTNIPGEGALVEAVNRAGGLPRGRGASTRKRKKRPRKSVEDDPYQRPNKFRRGVRDKVWKEAKEEDGQVRDPVTGEEIDENDPWDMGHKPGWEFRKHKAQAELHKPTRRRFLDEHNTASHYRPELPTSNQGHQGESGDDVDYWKEYYDDNPVEDEGG